MLINKEWAKGLKGLNKGKNARVVIWLSGLNGMNASIMFMPANGWCSLKRNQSKF